MNDDIEFLRGLFRPYDPLRRGRLVETPRLAQVVDFTDSNGAKPTRATGRRERYLAVAASAAAVAMVATAGVWAAGTWQRGQPASNPAGVSAPSPDHSPTAVPGFDHVRWQDWSGGDLSDTVSRWISSDGHGRIIETNVSGQITRDLTIVPPAQSSVSATANSTASPSASLAPTQGTDEEAAEYPGIVPANPAQLRAYLSGGQNDNGHLGQRIVGLLFARVLTGQQQTELIGIADSIATASPTSSTDPNGRPVELLPIPQASSRSWLAISPDGSHIVGVCYDQVQQNWRLLTLSEVTPTTN